MLEKFIFCLVVLSTVDQLVSNCKLTLVSGRFNVYVLCITLLFCELKLGNLFWLCVEFVKKLC